MAIDSKAIANGNYIDLRQIGASGLRQFSGYIHESTLKELEGRRAVEVYKEMSQNDATAGVILYAIDKLLRQVKWHVNPASTASFDIEAAEFVESCMHDMEMSWSDFLSEQFLGMLTYGHSLAETVYKRRGGDCDEPHLNSRFADGRIGWRGHMGRSQDTIYRWLFDDNGRLTGAEQQAPPHFRITTLPLSKCLLFRTSAEKGNPEGRSIFRSSYRGYYIKRGLENLEAVGAEKDITGLPIVWVPRELLAQAEGKAVNEDGSVNEEVQFAKAMVSKFTTMATEIRRDAHEGLVMPLELDENGNKKFDITLLASGGTRQFDLDKIVQRWDQRIAMGVMADFLLLGQGATATGSWAMHSDKTKLFLQSIEAFLGIFCEILNNQAVARLMRYNTMQMSELPRIEFGSLSQIDLQEQADFLVKCTQAGMEAFPDKTLEDHFRRIAGWPEKVQELVEVSDVRPQPSDADDHTPELHDDLLLAQGLGIQDPLTGNVLTNAPPRNTAPATNTNAPSFAI